MAHPVTRKKTNIEGDDSGKTVERLKDGAKQGEEILQTLSPHVSTVSEL